MQGVQKRDIGMKRLAIWELKIRKKTRFCHTWKNVVNVSGKSREQSLGRKLIHDLESLNQRIIQLLKMNALTSTEKYFGKKKQEAFPLKHKYLGSYFLWIFIILKLPSKKLTLHVSYFSPEKIAIQNWNTHTKIIFKNLL